MCLRLPGGEHRPTTTEMPPALRGPREEKAETCLCKQKKERRIRAAELKGEADTVSLLSILLPSENPSCLSH